MAAGAIFPGWLLGFPMTIKAGVVRGGSGLEGVGRRREAICPAGGRRHWRLCVGVVADSAVVVGTLFDVRGMSKLR